MTLIEELRRKQTTEREAAAAIYKALLLRHETPESGDVERLSEVMNILGRSEADLPGDLAIAKQLIAHEHATARQAELQKARADARATLNTVGQEAEQARRALEDKLKGRFDKAGAACQAAIGAVSANQQVLDQSADAVRFGWPALIEGIAVEIYREHHRSRREHTLPDKSRSEVLEGCLGELALGTPVVGAVRDYVDRHLKTHALQPVTDAEWKGLLVGINKRRAVNGLKPLEDEFKREAPPAPHRRTAAVAHDML